MTLGCKVNTADSEELDSALKKRGAFQTNQYPDICFLFSCTVTGKAAAKSRRAIRNLYKKHDQPKIVLLGCMANSIDDKTLSELPVSMKISPAEPVDQIIKRVESLFNSSEYRARINTESSDFFEKGSKESVSKAVKTGRTRAVVKVQTGCISFCSYCIIPYVRGPVRSVELQKVINLIKELEQKDYKEVVLTGINIGCYGMDRGKKDFPGFLENILKNTSIPRIRISSIEPLDVNDRLLDVMLTSSRICPHLHLPVQSGSQRILSLMKRPYSIDEYLEIVSKARKRMPELNITTDIIAGFPSETQEDHLESINIIRKAKITKVHAFPYSRRKGTKAYDMKPVVPGNIASAWVRELIQEGEKNYSNYVEKISGQKRRVLLEQRDTQGNWTGFTRDYLKTTVISAEGESELENFLHNSIISVKVLKKAGPENIIACPV